MSFGLECPGFHSVKEVIIISMEEDSPQLTDPTPQMDDHVDTALRPSTLASLIGQEQVKQISRF